MRIAAKKLLFLFVVLSLLLAACTPVAPGATGEGDAAEAEQVTLAMWLGVGSAGSEQAQCVIDNILVPYSTQVPGVKVEGVMQANLWEAMRTAVAGGGGPDVVTTPGPSFVFEMAQAGQLLPLSDYAEELGWSESLDVRKLCSGMARVVRSLEPEQRGRGLRKLHAAGLSPFQFELHDRPEAGAVVRRL